MTKDELDIKINLLIVEANRWVGTKEEGNNAGQIVTMFQNWDGSPDHVSYCMAFVQFCLKNVDAQYSAVLGECTKDRHLLERSEHCLTVWNKSPLACRSDKPVEGSVVVWQHGTSASGHTGIVTGLKMDSEFFTTIEANTSGGPGVERNGDGVYSRTRSVKGDGKMKVLGFLNPWGHPI